MMHFVITLWGDSKLAKTEWSGSLTSRVVSNACVTAELAYSAAHVHHEVLAWRWAPASGPPVRASRCKPGCCCPGAALSGIMAVLPEAVLRLRYGFVTASLWFCPGCCCGWDVSPERGWAAAAVHSGDGKRACGPPAPGSPSRLLARVLPTPGSAISAKGETVSVTHRVSKTKVIFNFCKFLCVFLWFYTFSSLWYSSRKFPIPQGYTNKNWKCILILSLFLKFRSFAHHIYIYIYIYIYNLSD